ncbi:hypothetical protein DSO57_1006873 [Entomophthora muscae]|uniref:Uncharacterized protein n=1 Tax=Entomophthora muscae TaxID=34485 RepID=A0ACC2T7G8_9FUNG|nr:hypothetical protein DSO57_1006873 [Entomophthora muscae]
MKPPVTPKPMPASAAELPLNHTDKLFGIVYIILTGLIDTIVPNSSLWSWVGKSMSYLIKSAPILWWAMHTQSVTCQLPEASKPEAQGWFPDTFIKAGIETQCCRKWLVNCLGMELTISLFQGLECFVENEMWRKGKRRCVKTQQLGEYFSKIRNQVDDLEACECHHNWIDCHHPSKDLGVNVIASEITGKICEYIVYTGVYGYRLGGVGQYQRGPGVLLGGV